MTTTVTRTATVSLLTLLVVLLVTVPAAAGVDDWPGQTRQEVRQATLREAADPYLDIARATADGYSTFVPDEGFVQDCITESGEASGVRLVGALDSHLDPSRPEALVYESGADGRARLVAVDYMMPSMFVEDGRGNMMVAPEIFGQPLRKHATLPIYVLRAWIQEEDPQRVFAETNPTVSACLPV